MMQIDELMVAEKLDEYLKVLNDDYRVERQEAIREVSAEILPLHVFYDWMKSRGKEGGAHKFPRVLKGESLVSWQHHVHSLLRARKYYNNADSCCIRFLKECSSA